MRTEDLLEQCLQALSSGQEIPLDVARYLARHPEQRSELEDLLFIAQRASRLQSAELSPVARKGMQNSLAARLGLDPATLNASTQNTAEQFAGLASRRKPLLSIGRVSLTKLRYAPPDSTGDIDSTEARIRAAFRDLTPEDIRRYIGVRGEDYLYYRQRFPGWEPVFAFMAAVLRGFKRLEKLTSL